MKTQLTSIFAATLICVALTKTNAQAAEWGNLKGKFVYDGAAPAPKALDINKDPACCQIKHNDETLVVGPDGGIANVIVYVRTAKVPVSPEYAADEKAVVKFDNKTCRFEPHVLPIRLSQSLEVTNSDNCGHNTNVTPLGDQAFNQLLAPAGNIKHTFKRQQNIPIKVVCNIHPWMVGYILPRDNPYTAVSAADGSFELKNLPAQDLEFKVWHEKNGYVVTPKWAKGEFKMKIKPGENDLGTVKLKL